MEILEDFIPTGTFTIQSEGRSTRSPKSESLGKHYALVDSEFFIDFSWIQN